MLDIDSKKWPYRPFCVQIELVQGCNRNCSFCGTSGLEKKLHFVDKSVIEHTCRLIKEADLNCRILLAGHGEPSLHPEVVEIVRLIRSILPVKNRIHLFTNGIVMLKNPQIIFDLFDAGLNGLLFDEYSDHLVENTLKVVEGIDKYKIVKLKNGVPMFDARELQRICIAPPIDIENLAAHKLCNHCGAGMPKLKGSEVNNHKRCSIIFRDFFVRYDGNIAICCNDFRGEYYVTNIMDHKYFRDVYFHERLESARKYIINKDRSFYPCNICNVSPVRPGLLPDMKAKVKLDNPTDDDWEIVNRKYPPLAQIRLRDYEMENNINE